MRKACKRKPRSQYVNPLVFKLEPSADAQGKTTGWRVEVARIINLLKAGEFDHTQSNRTYEFLATCFVIARMSRREDIYEYIGEAADCFSALLTRSSRTGKWVATDDEIKTLSTHMDTMAEAIGALPESTIKLAMARSEQELLAMAEYTDKRRKRAGDPCTTTSPS